MSIRPATLADCDRIGAITFAGSMSWMVGAIPSDAIDWDWSAGASAAAWRSSWPDCTDRGQRFEVLESADVLAWIWWRPFAEHPTADCSIKGLYVDPRHHGRGLGRRLFDHAISSLRGDGHDTVEVGCVVDNPACGFYRRLGGRPAHVRPITVDAHRTEEIMFEWQL